jgi:hypothetical protein
MAKVCGKTLGLKKKWFMCVNQKLGEISVMMRRRDHWKISKTCQVGSEEFLIFQVGREKKMRLFESIESSEVSSCQQGVLMEMGSIDLIDCQVGSRKTPKLPGGK